MTEPLNTLVVDPAALRDLANRVTALGHEIAASAAAISASIPALTEPPAAPVGSALAALGSPRLMVADVQRLSTTVGGWAQIAYCSIAEFNASDAAGAERFRPR